MTFSLKLTLLTDGTFGQGTGVPGLVDTEVQYDPYTGLPEIPGRSIKGLLAEECANTLYALRAHRRIDDFEQSAIALFGNPGSTHAASGCLRIGTAQLPIYLRAAVQDAVQHKKHSTRDILSSLTTIRRQTAIDERTGAPARGTLRAVRTVLRDTVFTSPLAFSVPPQPEYFQLLAACCLAVKRGGLSRNRGRGLLRVRLLEGDVDVTPVHFDQWKTLLW